MNADSSEAKNKQAAATSVASHSRPSGTFDKNLSRFSGVSGRPEKDSNLQGVRYLAYDPDVNEAYSPVPPSSGQIEFTRIWCGPNSAASPFVACGSLLATL